MRRVLKPGGRLLFVEHGRAPDTNMRWWQDHLNPAWKRLGGGCHLNRAIGILIEDAGFHFERIETGYKHLRVIFLVVLLVMQKIWVRWRAIAS
jgi:hypothetical protein